MTQSTTNPTEGEGDLAKPLVLFADQQPSTDEDEWLYQEEYQPPFLPALIIAFPILPFFWRYHVRVSRKQLSFGYNYGVTAHQVNKSEIVEVSPIDHVNGLLEWGGWGIRKNLRWETGYIAKNGSAIRIVTKDASSGTKKAFVFNCEDPKTVCELLTGGHASAQWSVKIYN